MDLIKFERFCTPKETINIMKRQLTEWGKALQIISPCFKVSILLLSLKRVFWHWSPVKVVISQ